MQPLQVTVLNFTLDNNGEEKIDQTRRVPFVVQEDTKCDCECKLRAEHCNSLQIYDETECACVCRNTDEYDKCIVVSSSLTVYLCIKWNVFINLS